MATPAEILESAFKRATGLTNSLMSDPEISSRIELIARNEQNRAGVRVILACCLAKVHKPALDIRKPYTEIGESDAYSGRSYDEQYVTPFINRYNLPCNTTTAFLTPALRNRNTTLTPNLNLMGRPISVYKAILELLSDVYTARITAEDLLVETISRLKS